MIWVTAANIQTVSITISKSIKPGDPEFFPVQCLRKAGKRRAPLGPWKGAAAREICCSEPPLSINIQLPQPCRNPICFCEVFLVLSSLKFSIHSCTVSQKLQSKKMMQDLQQNQPSFPSQHFSVGQKVELTLCNLCKWNKPECYMTKPSFSPPGGGVVYISHKCNITSD